MKKPSLSILSMAFALCASVNAAEHVVKSPDGKTVVTIDVTDSQLTYELAWQGESLLKPSQISLFNKANYEVLGAETKTVDESWKPTWGQFSKVRDHCQQLTVQLKASGKRVDLVCQVYDDGLGFRFVVPAQAGLAQTAVDYQFECQVEGDYDYYSGRPERTDLFKSQTKSTGQEDRWSALPHRYGSRGMARSFGVRPLFS